MKLSVNEQRNILKHFPKLELSYEKKSHKKVQSDICLTIPKGKKYFAWFKTYKRNNLCFLLEIDRRYNSIENITVGDFIVRAGQGLVIWQGYTSGKSENVLGIAKTGQGVRGYTSVDENFYFRGTTGTLKIGDGKLSLFYSRKKMDGNIVSPDSDETYFTSLQTSGYHRTQNEINDEKSVKCTNIGGIFSWSFKNLKIGKDISMIALGDWEKALDYDPPLTSRKQPDVTIAEDAVKLLVAQIEGDSTIIQRFYDTELVIRESTKSLD